MNVMKRKGWPLLLGVIGFSLLLAPKAYANHGNAEDNYGYPLRIYQCDDQTPAERKAAVDREDGLSAFTKARTGVASVKVGSKTYPIKGKYLYENCLFVYGDPDDVPKNEWIRNPNTGENIPMYLGYDYKGNVYPNPAHPEWFAENAYTLTRSDFVWYKKPWTKPWGSFAPFDRIVGDTQNPNDAERKAALARALDKYYNKTSIGRFASDHPQEGKPWINGSDASVLSQYADVIYLGDDWSAGTFTLYFAHSAGHSSTLHGYSTFFIPPRKNPFAGNVRVTSWLPPDIYHGEDFKFRTDIYNDAMGESIKVPCAKSGTTVRCNDNDETDKHSYFYKFKKGFDQPYGGNGDAGQGNVTTSLTVKNNDREYDRPGYFNLAAGDYTLWVKVPEYQNETTFGDNYVEKNFTVKPVDLEVLKSGYDMTPVTRVASGEKIESIKVNVRNNTDKAYTNVKITHKWENEATVYCQILPNINANTTMNVTLSTNTLADCAGSPDAAKNVYPKNENTDAKYAFIDYVVKIDGRDEIAEVDENNNEKSFGTLIRGVNASVDLEHSNSYYKSVRGGTYTDDKYHDLPFYIRMIAENMLENRSMNAPCGTDCYDTKNKTFRYAIAKKGTNDVILQGERTFTNLLPAEEYSARPGSFGDAQEDMIKLPPGDYDVSVYLPYYSNEYTYKDNVITKTITVKPVDLELMNSFTIEPAPSTKSGTPVEEIYIEVTNHNTFDMRDIAIEYYWQSNPSVKYCEQVAVMPKLSTRTITLATEANELCAGETKKPSTEYPRYEEEVPQKEVGLVVNVNPNKSTTESDYTNNKRTFNVMVDGLNAFISSVKLNYYAVDNDESKVTIQSKVANDMIKNIDADCSTNFNTHEICKYASKNKTLTYHVYDVNWTKDDTSDDTLVKTWTKTYQNIPEKKATQPITTSLELPPGMYKLEVRMPHYKYEYRYDDNYAERYFEVDISKDNENIDCKETKTQYLTEDIAKFCIGTYPKFPSTTVEGGQGAYYYVKYRFFPMPLPPYEIDNNLGTNKVDFEGEKDWSDWAHYTDTSHWSNVKTTNDAVLGQVFQGKVTNMGSASLYDDTKKSNGDYRYTFENGKTYLYSVWLKADSAYNGKAFAAIGHNYSVTSSSDMKDVSLTTKWKRYDFTVKSTKSGDDGIMVNIETPNGKTVSAAMMSVAEVGSDGKSGVQQQFQLVEPRNELGDADTFLHYPKAKKGSDNHYQYRGRMMPKTITFDFQIEDPNGTVLPESVGQIVYDIPDECYSDTQVDFENKRTCREVTFYAPNKNATLTKKDEVVDEPERIKFKNPGLHTFDLKVTETQSYRYQRDEGTGNTIKWSDPAWSGNFTQTDSNWKLNFKSPTTNFKPPASLYDFTSWTTENDPYRYYHPFGVTGMSTGTGNY